MKRTRHLLAGAASAIAIAALPLNLESIASGSLELSSAFAKSDHSGGNGGGNGGGGGARRLSVAPLKAASTCSLSRGSRSANSGLRTVYFL